MHRVCAQLILGAIVFVAAASAQAQSGRITFQGAVVTPTLSWPSGSPASAQTPLVPLVMRQIDVPLASAPEQPQLLAYALRREPRVAWKMVVLTYR